MPKGDGVADDTGGVQAALASGCGPLIDGENLTYRITKTLTLAKARGLTVANATLIDDVPVEVWERRVLSVSASSDVVLKSLRFDRGSDTTLTNGTENPPNQLRTLFIDKSKSVTIEDVEVWGDGAGTAIYILESDDVRVSRAHIHDMHATAPSVHEMLIGIWPVHSSNITIEAPRIRNLFGKALRLPVESDGISISGSRNLTITDADIAFVNEGIDMSGSRASHDFVVRNSVVSDASNVCYKFTWRRL